MTVSIIFSSSLSFKINAAELTLVHIIY